jgi:hypothetical protein
MKHQGLPGATVHRGNTNVIQDAVDKVWDSYYQNDFVRVETQLLKLRKLSPYKYRELKEQLAEDIHDRT